MLSFDAPERLIIFELNTVLFKFWHKYMDYFLIRNVSYNKLSQFPDGFFFPICGKTH